MKKMARRIKKLEKAISQQVAVPQVKSNGVAKSYQPLKEDEAENKTVLEGVRSKVFLDRYALKDKDGSLLEQYPEQMWRRVAWGISQSERKKDQKLWEDRFYQVMKDFKFVPGGRILSGAGTGYEVTYYNCFVIPSPQDSRQGILDSLKQLVEIQSRSGGVGLNLSSLRPRGARVKKVNGFSSGPVTWAGLFSYATHDVVQQGGSRRGATMLMLHDWHPDVEEFITVKQDLTKINGANLSVCVSDAFMEAVKNDSDWELIYPDLDDPEYDQKWNGEIDEWKALGKKVKVYKTVKAKDLWNMICGAAWRSAEPGLHFLERSNKRSNCWYFEKLLATNPCLTADTWIHTNEGPRQIKDLIGRPFIARVNGQNHLSSPNGFFSTGIKDVVNLQTEEGYALSLTGNHLVKRKVNDTLKIKRFEWCEAGKLNSGDYILLHDHRSNTNWRGSYTHKEGYLLGLLVGDGTLKSDKAVLSVWDFPIHKNSKVYYKTGTQQVMQYALNSAMSMPHRSDFSGWMYLPDRNEHRMSLAYIKHLAHELGMYPGNKAITPKMEKTSSNFYKGFLKGLFDADGSVQLGPQGRINVRLSQSNLELLFAIQRMLLRLGIVSKIYQNRRPLSKKLLPDGKGGYKEYKTKAQHELVISRNNLDCFNETIGFADSDKSNLLTKLLKSHSKLGRYNEYFIAKVKSVEYEAKKEVYDASIPGVNAFDANGIIAHNCGEQPLGAWSVCNLGAMNLNTYVKDGQFDFESFGQDVKVATRFLDNVIDQTYYFFPENEKRAKEIRRTGLGIMGLADALIKMQVRYGSEESLPVIRKIFEVLRDNAYEASSDIAKEKGAFPKFDAEKYLQGYHIKRLPDQIREKIAKQGIRNAVLLTIAPTGTTSLVSGVSSGVEPVYEFEFIRRDRIGEHKMFHPLFDAWKNAHPDEAKPDYFVSANDLTPLEHVKVQAVAQEFIDSSISKTVNAPNSHTVEAVKTLYMAAYDMGLKGITYMRDGSREGVLSRVDQKPKEVKEEASKPVHRPMVLQGRTYEVLTPVGKAFITVNRDSKGDPMELFATVGKGGMHVMADAEAIGRLVSIALRASNDPKRVITKIVSQLRGIGGSSQVGFGKDRVMSLADGIAKVLAEELAVNSTTLSETAQEPLPLSQENNGNGVVHQDAQTVVGQLEIIGSQVKIGKNADLCPECGNASLVFEEGCSKCYSCGFSKC